MKLRYIQPYNSLTAYAAMWDAERDDTRTGAVFVSGLNGLATHLFTRPVGVEDQLDLTLPTIGAGYTVISPPSGAGWGNASSVQMVSDLIDWAIANLDFPDGPVHYYGQSHGGLIGLKCLMNSAVARKIKSMVIAIAPTDIQALHAENRAGLAASISAAYGGAPADADNPIDRYYTIRDSGVPILQIHGETDTIGTFAEAQAFSEATETSLVSMGAAVGHSLIFDRDLIWTWFADHED